MPENNDRNNFFSGFFWKFNEQITAQIVSFIVSIILARLLTPKDYGIVSLVNVFIVISEVFVTSGFSTSLIQKRTASRLDFSTIFYCSLLFSILVYVVIYCMAPTIADFYNNNQLVSVLRIFALRLPISAFNSIQMAYVSRELAFRKIFVSTSIATLLSGVLGIVMAYMGFGVWALVIQYISSSVFQMIVLFLEIPWKPRLEFSWNSAKSLMGYGWKILVASLLGTFFNEFRSLIIGKFYNAQSLAYYNRGSRFPELIGNNIDTTVSSVLFPVMSKYSNDMERLKAMVRRSIKTTTYIIMPIMLGLAVAAKPITVILLTDKWLPSVPFMQCLCISGVFGSISNANMQVVKASGRSDVILKLELIKKPIYFVLLLLAIRLDVLAVAVTMAIYNIIGTLINMAPNKRVINYSYKEQFRDVLPAMMLSIVMAIVVYPISLVDIPYFVMLLLEIGVGATVYIGLSFIFKLESYWYLLKYIKSRFGREN